jgi:hypothetical protein
MKNLLLAAALVSTLVGIGQAHAAGDVLNDSGARIGEAQDCDGSQCDVVNDAGDHIGTADDCQFNDSCDVTNDAGDHIGTLDNDDSE